MSDSWEDRIRVVRSHFEAKGYRLHSGLQFGGELVLYADDPSRVHSDFCVHVVPEDGSLDWRQMQSLVRSMPGLHKTLILAYPRRTADGTHVVDELAMATEHAPFRHKKATLQVGGQRKKARTGTASASASATTHTGDDGDGDDDGDEQLKTNQQPKEDDAVPVSEQVPVAESSS